MKRHFFRRTASFVLAAILVAESSMTASAAQQTVVTQAATVQETEVQTQEVGTAAQQTEAQQAGQADDRINVQETQTESMTETQVSQETGAGTGAEHETEAGSEAESEKEAETENATETAGETENGVEEESETETETEIETETEWETESQPETESETEIESETEWETESERETETESVIMEIASLKLDVPVIDSDSLQVALDGKVSFSWKLVEGADGYQVYRSTSYSFPENATTKFESGMSVDGEKVLFTDETAELGVFYYYRVRAYRVDSESGTEEASLSNRVDNEVKVEDIAWSDAAFADFAMKKGETKTLSIAYTPVNATASNVSWSSNNTNVAEVADGVVTAKGKGTAIITARVAGKAITANVSVSVDVEKISLNKTALNLREGAAAVLRAVAEPSDAETSIFWESSNTDIATVDQSGVVRAKKVGTAVITASGAGKNAQCTVQVTVPVNKVVLEKTEIELVKGGESKEVAVTIEPSTATIRDIAVEVTDPSLLTGNVEAGKVVLTSGDKLGKTTVKVSADGQCAEITVNVVEEATDTDDSSDVIPVRKLSFNLLETERTILLETGAENVNTYQLTPEILPANASNKHITWSSSDELVAVVSASGLITAKGEGMAMITAKTDNGVYDRVTVKVSDGLEEFEMIGDYLTLYCNADKAVFDGQNLRKTYDIVTTESGISCVYRSANEEVVTVDETGHVVAVAPGETQVIAVHPESGKSDVMTFKVERLVEEINVPAYDITVALDTKIALDATVGPEEVTNSNITWVLREGKNCLAQDSKKQNVFVANRVGTAKIAILTADKGDVEAEIRVTVEAVSAVKKCSLTYNGKTTAKIGSGQQMQLVTSMWDKNGDDISKEYGKKTVVYKSSNEKVATVDETGKVTALTGGTAKITASVMDGSNVSATCTVTVEQRPEQIVFDREEYVVAPKGSVTLKPSILPANTKNKQVTWKITGIDAPAGCELSDTEIKKMITINSAGKVTVNAKAPTDMVAYVQCTSKAFGKTETALSAEVKVIVGKTPVSSLKMNKTSLELIGLGTEATIAYTAKGADENTFCQWTSSNEEVVSVNQNGVVKVQSYGTAKITLCVDNAKTATCTVAAYPVKKGQGIKSAYGSYGIQQAENDGNDYVQLYFINSSTKEILDAQLLEFTSSNPELVYVDEKGIAYANPYANLEKDTNVTITAALKDDPFKRKATAKVTVWKEDQVKNMKFLYMGEGEKLFSEITDHVEEKYTEKTSFKLRVETYDAESNLMQDAKVAFGVSDSNMASIEVDEKDESGHTIIVTVKNPGKFKITCMSKDKMAVNRQVTFGMYEGTPVIKEASLGTINKSAAQTNHILISDTEFTMVGANGTEIDGDDIDISSVTAKKMNGAAMKVDGNAFHIAQLGANKYQLQVDSRAIEDVKPGTYSIEFEVERSYMSVESQWADTTTETVKSTFTIADTVPGVKISNVTVNSFERGTWTKLKINTAAEVENITLASEFALKEYYEVMERQDGWYIAIKEDKFDACASKRLKGVFLVELEGYEEPVRVSATVTAKSTKPSLKQLNVPDILVKQGTTAEITLYNNTAKQNLTDYQISLKTEKNKKWRFAQNRIDETIDVELCNGDAEVDTDKITKAASYKQKVVVNKDGWRTPIELDVTVKVTPKKANPSVTFDKKGVTLNTTVNESYGFVVKANKSNVTFKEGDWTFANASFGELFDARYEDGRLIIGLNQDAVAEKRITKNSYTLQFVDVIEEEGYEKVKTASIKVSINKKTPTVTVKMAGKMDLLDRKASTLSATVTVGGLTADIADVTLVNGEDSTFTDNFYSVQVKNKITICARSAAELKAGTAYKGKVQITLKNGTVLQKDISVKPMQSVPKLKAIEKQTVYKAEADKVLDYNLNKVVPSGVRIKSIVTRVLPAGFGVEYDNGHAYVVLNDDSIRTGQYTVQADVYFEGAQKIAGSDDGKPVRVKINVQVKEQ